MLNINALCRRLSKIVAHIGVFLRSVDNKSPLRSEVRGLGHRSPVSVGRGHGCGYTCPILKLCASYFRRYELTSEFFSDLQRVSDL